MPYPVQVLGTELLMEFIGEPDGVAAPRLAETRRRGASLAGLWEQLVEAMCVLARLGLAHGDLSAYNLLVHREQLVMIDTPQVVDVIANPRGGEYLDRDAGNVSNWFAARDLTALALAHQDPDELAAVLRSEARLGPGLGQAALSRPPGSADGGWTAEACAGPTRRGSPRSSPR